MIMVAIVLTRFAISKAFCKSLFAKAGRRRIQRVLGGRGAAEIGLYRLFLVTLESTRRLVTQTVFWLPDFFSYECKRVYVP